MSDEGEKTCPLCAEEMDLTDQQLKPCKCGYEICVWCWHHIMDMAEKDNTEGRCPACRTPYNKEKIVGTASKCESLVTGMSVEKKQRSQKGKIKSSEGRKQLGSVRVIQRNLVYIVGLPLNLADEDLLQQKEYFGQYGKVLKVSISRTAAGAIQQFANSTCSVYITYSKEEEAIRSIQSTNGFILEGRPLRACHGTTKYCHAWLRNAPCTNADCLYLHEFGPQEDSFSKDDLISAYTRVQQITGATYEMQRRSGNLLPPPLDDHSNNTAPACPKPINKTTTNTNNPANNMKVSPPNSSSGRSVALPAAASWGTRASNSQPIVANLASSKGPSKQQTDSFSSSVTSPLKKHSEENQEETNNNREKVVGPTHRRTLSETTLVTPQLPSSSSISTSSSQLSTATPLKDKTKSSSSDASKHYSKPVVDKDPNVPDKNQRLQFSEAEKFSETLASTNKDLVSDLQEKVAQVAISKTEEDLLSFNDQRLTDTQVVTHTNYTQNLSQFSSPPNSFINYSPQDQNLDKAPQNVFNRYSSTSNGHSSFHDTEVGRNKTGMFEEATSANGAHSTALDVGESSIISNIFSMDFDPWDESLTSPQNLAKFLGGSEKQSESHGVLNSRKAQNNNQSRFAFARQDESTDQGSNFAPNLSDFGRGFEHKNFGSGFVGNNGNYFEDKINVGNGFSSFSYEDSDNFANNYSPMSENKISGSRSQVSAPPGFAGVNRAPPPGFTSHERMEQTFDSLSGNHMFDTSSLLRKAHQPPAPVNNDLEFMDPAILAVGGRIPNTFDMKSNFHTQQPPNPYENDIRLQLLMQRSFSQQNPRFTEVADAYPHQQSDSYGIIPSRIVEQSLPNNLSSYLQQTNFQQPRNNGHWNGWNEVQGGNDIAVAELLRNERLGFNRYYSGHEDAKFQLSTSADLYNRSYGI